MVPHRPQRHLSWQLWAGGLGALVLFTPLQASTHHDPSSFQHSEAHSDLDSADSREARIDPAPPVVAPPTPVPIQERRPYRTARSLHHGYFANTNRRFIPKMMQTFRLPPKITNEYEFIDWLAERDALIDRALALGYVIGTLENVVSGRSSWSAIGTGQICGTIFSYSVGCSSNPEEKKRALEKGWGIFSRARVPKNGDAVLLSRGWAMLSDDDTEPRPYIPIPRLFLPEPKVG